jgi:hypothetical protein
MTTKARTVQKAREENKDQPPREAEHKKVGQSNKEKKKWAGWNMLMFGSCGRNLSSDVNLS